MKVKVTHVATQALRRRQPIVRSEGRARNRPDGLFVARMKPIRRERNSPDTYDVAVAEESLSQEELEAAHCWEADDRVPRRPLLMGEHAALACVVLLLFLVRDEGDVWLLYVVAFLYGLGSTIGQAARPALMKVIVPDELLGDANGLLQTAAQGLPYLAQKTSPPLFLGPSL